MPELPEVETMALDLAPLVTGATIREAWWDWDRLIRYPDPAEFGRGLAGLQVLGVGRRAKWLLLQLSEGRVLPIQVKMTGHHRTV